MGSSNSHLQQLHKFKKILRIALLFIIIGPFTGRNLEASVSGFQMPGQTSQTLAPVGFRLTKLISWARFFSPCFLIFLLRKISRLPFQSIDSSNQVRRSVPYLILKDYCYGPQVFCTFQRALTALASACPLKSPPKKKRLFST